MKKILITCITLLLFVCSCSKDVQNFTVSVSIVASYTQQPEPYQNILNNSPVPVYVMDMETFSNDYLLETTYLNDPNASFKKFHGMFVINNKVKDWPKSFIFINSSLTSDELIGTYFHELGHYACYKKRCPCIRDSDRSYIEYHAFINESKLSRANDFMIPLFIFMQETISHLNKKDSELNYIRYRSAAKKFRDSKHWDECIEYLKSKGVGTEIFKMF